MQTDAKIQYMTNEESYTQRRMLFKDIWETAMSIDDKDDIMNKPKVIKTLRLDEVDKCVVGKTKKQRIKNLRHVCNRILDFCDRQDADEVFYEQFAADGHERVRTIHKLDPKNTKKKTHRGKKKIKKAKSLFVSKKVVKHIEMAVSERKAAGNGNAVSIPSPVPEKKALKSKGKPVKAKSSPVKDVYALSPAEAASVLNDSDDSQGPFNNRTKKLAKKKTSTSKRKKPSESGMRAIDMMKTKTPGYRPRATSRVTTLAKPIPELTTLIL